MLREKNLGTRKRSVIFNTILLLLFAACLALSLTMRVFSFYTLQHYLKIVFIGYLTLVIALFLLRFVRPIFQKRALKRGKLILSAALAIILTAVIFLVIPYHIEPIRTTHTLEIINEFDFASITVDEI